jgi:hypothetical protein
MHNNAQQQLQLHQYGMSTASHITTTTPVPPPAHVQTEQVQLSPLEATNSSLVAEIIASQLLSKVGGDAGAALGLFQSAHHFLSMASAAAASPATAADPLSIATAAVKQMQMAQECYNQQHPCSSSAFLSTCKYHGDDEHNATISDNNDEENLLLATTPPPPDIYREDEGDVGPRILSTPVRRIMPTTNSFSSTSVTTTSTSNLILMEAVTLFNRALIHHTKSQYVPAKQLYKLLACAIQNLLAGMSSNSSTSTTNTPCVTLLEIGVRLPSLVSRRCLSYENSSQL